MTAIIILIGGTVLNFFVNAGSVWFFSKFFKFSRASFGRAAMVTLVIAILSIAIVVPQIFLAAKARIVYSVVAFPLELFFWCLVLKRSYRTTFVRSWAGVGILLLSQVLVLTFTLLVIRPSLLHAYSLPTSSMAPTLRGPYRVAKCPYCGGELLVPIEASRVPYVPVTEFGICVDCIREAVIPTADVSGPVVPCDRILVTGFLKPRRWDVVAVRHAGDVYVKRLVALPGETVSINEDGQISVNGSLIGPPPDAPKLRYMWPEYLEAISGSHKMRPNELLHLGGDDYFLLGDNSMRSSDSRFLGPFHKADIVGVVTAVYWPWDRIRILR